MTNRTMDVIVTGVVTGLPHGMRKIWYGFPVGNHGITYADIYPETDIDLSWIKPEMRLIVESEERMVRVWKHRAQNYVFEPKYVWTHVREVPPKSPLRALTAKQREKSERLASKPRADDGSLFTW
jgi:hypothetical protein